MKHKHGNVPNTPRRGGLVGLLAMALLLCLPLRGAGHGLARGLTAPTTMTGLQVRGNQILNGSGTPVLLHGVNRSGAEYACVQGWGIFDGPVDAASVQAIAAWHVNVVRVPLNEDCWLGINGVNPAYGGANYQQAIGSFVSTLSDAGMAVILDLHFAAPGTQPATGQLPMPDADHTTAFWSSIANAFKGRSNVLFDLFNEPFPDNNIDTTAAWRCLRDGGTCPGVSYQAAGTQSLVDAVRATGATNIVMVPGVQYTSSLSQWSAYLPNDSLHQLTAAWHVYDFSACHDSGCWNSSVAPVLAQVPLIVGELGESDCAHGFIDPLMAWLDQHNASYLAWTWDTWDCNSGPALISSYDGTPTGFGAGYRDHLTQLAVQPTAAQISSPTPGATLGSGATTFSWSGGVGVTDYSLSVGSQARGQDLYAADLALATSATVAGLPADGRTLYVRLGSQISGAWQYRDYIYMAFTCAPVARADITSPTGGAIDSSTVTLQWGGGSCVTQYWLYAGSSYGQADLFSSGSLPSPTTTQTVSGLPVDGRTVYVRLWSLVNSNWQAVDHRYIMGSCKNPARADITAPTGGNIATGTPTFTWGGGACVTQYYLYVGSSFGQADLYAAGPLASTVTSQTISPAIPVDGRSIFVRLWSLVNGQYQAVDHSYLMGACQNGAKADITAPASTTHTNSQFFQWSGGTCVTQYYLYVGSAIGQADLFSSGPLSGTVTAQTVTGLPANNSTVSVRLWSLVNGSWQAVDRSYVSAP